MTRGAARGVVIERLRLEGFGRHRVLELRFAPGVAVWAAPNERGKTTALLGLAATLWGVAHRTDPAQPGWGRYRSWFGGPHRGEVTLVDRRGVRVTIERAFETHRVRVRRHDPGGDVLEVDATHNPAARVALGGYEAWLRDALGVADGDVVLATAVLAQGDVGGDPHRLSADVQRLLSGAGAGGAAAALERLADALRERTRWLRRLELGLADLRQPRRLEQLEDEAVELAREAERGRAAADALERARRDRDAAEATLDAARDAAEAALAEAAAARSWRSLRDDARRAAERVHETRRAAARARALGEALEAADAELAALAELAVPSADAEAEVRALEVALRDLAAASRRRDEAQGALARHRREGAPGDDAAGGGEPGAASAAPSPWTRLGHPAAERLGRARRSARTLLRRAQAAAALRDRLRGDVSALERLSVFTSLTPEVLELVASYGQRERVLVERVEAARGRRDDLLERVQRHRAAFAEVRQLTPAQVTALEAFEEALERRRDPRPWRFAAAGAGALLGAAGVPIVLGLLDVTFSLAGLVGGLAGGLIGALVPVGDGTARARAALRDLEVEGDDDELRQRLRRRAAFDAQYEQVQADARALEAAEARLEEQEAEARAFLAAAQPVLEALPDGADVDEAYQTWLRLTPVVHGGRTELAALLVDLVEADVDPERFERTRVDAPEGPLAELVAVAHVVGGVPDDGEAPTLEALVAWAEAVEDEAWDRWHADATAADAAQTNAAELAEARRRERERRAAWEVALGDALASAETAHEAARAAARAAADVVARWWPLGDLRFDAPPAVEPPLVDALLIGDDEVSASVVDRAAAAVTDDARPSEVDAVAIAEHVARYRVAALRRSDAARALRDQLAPVGAGDAAALDARVRPAELALEGAMAAWRDLCARHAALPEATLDLGADDGAPAGEADARLDALERAARRADGEARAAADALLAAERQLAASSVGDVPNVAALLEASRSKAAEADDVREEVAALALAFEHLAASARDFVATHRRWLEQRAGDLLATLSDRPGRRLRLDDQFAASVVEASGDVAAPEQLSQGTRDLLAVALRVAVLDRLASDVPLPLVLDDPFVHWDAARTQRARAMLQALAGERQVLLLTHREELASWGERVVVVEEA